MHAAALGLTASFVMYETELFHMQLTPGAIMCTWLQVDSITGLTGATAGDSEACPVMQYCI